MCFAVFPYFLLLLWILLPKRLYIVLNFCYTENKLVKVTKFNKWLSLQTSESVRVPTL